MKNSKISYILILAAISALALSSCDSFLDTLPDNRATIDNEDKIKNLLTSAYPGNTYVLVTETMSDNVDDIGPTNPHTNRFFDQLYSWTDVTETANDSPRRFWNASYASIAAANQALEAIEAIGGTTTTTLKECKGEALLCRAYNYFMLVNMFCNHYNSATSEKDMGVPLIDKPETKLVVRYNRGTVAEVYKQIDKDIQEALPLIGDEHLSILKYHFNTQAAYAFASRFYLFYEQWDKAIEYATLCLGTNSKTMLRDWDYLASMPQGDAGRQAIEEHFISADVNANLLLATATSYAGVAFNPYWDLSRYAHSAYLAENEDISAENVWGREGYRLKPAVYSATNMDMTIMWRIPYLFEYTDPVARKGYVHTVIPLLTADECLLNRAEAYIIKKQYDKATADINLWLSNILSEASMLTTQDIIEFYNPADYSYDDEEGLAGTVKKHLHPAFAIDAEGSEQESMLQCVLGIRRIETLHLGLRWFDIKRYGIEIIRRQLGPNGKPLIATDVLKKDDPRRAIQLPEEVIKAGLPANPRNK